MQILLVDDNEIQAATRSAILTRSGLHVAIARNVQDALALLDRSEVQASIRLLVTDHLMPGMNGPELVRRLRPLLHTLPVLVLSGLPDAEREYEGLNVTFRVKPLHPEALIQLTSRLLADTELRSA